jgi:phosphotransferase system  glucose/maltose/N-acetylglucosamine-specific IIC component
LEQEYATAARVIIAIIPLAGIVMGAVVVFFYLLWDHKRKTLLIQAGQYVKPRFDLLTFSLLTGLLLSCVGLALTIFLAITLGASFGLLGGIIPLAIGIGLLVFYGIKRDNSKA